VCPEQPCVDARTPNRWRGEPNEIDAVPEIGPEIAASVREWFDEEENIALIEKLRAAGVLSRSSTSRTMSLGCWSANRWRRGISTRQGTQ